MRSTNGKGKRETVEAANLYNSEYLCGVVSQIFSVSHWIPFLSRVIVSFVRAQLQIELRTLESFVATDTMH